MIFFLKKDILDDFYKGNVFNNKSKQNSKEKVNNNRPESTSTQDLSKKIKNENFTIYQ